MIEIRQAEKIDTGSSSFNSILGGGLSKCALTDVYGAAATGKTQFAFQNAVMASANSRSWEQRKPLVVFVDCAGSFRPERIAEIAEARGIKSEIILDLISSIYVRSVAEQHEASEQIMTNEIFDHCELVIVDDVTTNFMAEYSSIYDQENERREKNRHNGQDVLIYRHFQLATYARKLAYLALSKNLAVLLTNSARSNIDNPKGNLRSEERETTGDTISEFGLFRLHLTKYGNIRTAEVIQPYVSKNRTNFSIESRGIVP